MPLIENSVTFLCTTKDSFLERIIFDENIFAVSVAKAKVVYVLPAE